MRKIKQHLKLEEVYSSCISNFQKKEKTKKFEYLKNEFVQKSNEYASKLDDSKLFELTKEDLLPTLEKDEAIKLYKDKLAKSGQPAYRYYTEILALAPDRICPYCNQVIASTLDHYLPKATYPLFSVTPLNLIPACKDCNTEKGEPKIFDNNDLHLHPYSDDIENHGWLKAKVIEGDYPIFVFYIDSSPDWDESLLQRLENHFNTFKIKRLYTTHAAKELNNLKYLKMIRSQQGRDGLVHQINLILSSSEKNTWKSAMLESMLNSDWFLEKGVELIN